MIWDGRMDYIAQAAVHKHPATEDVPLGGIVLHRSKWKLEGALGPNEFEQQSSPAGLVARIRNGDRGAEEELIARYSRGVTLILRRSASVSAAIEDLYQEVFLRAMEKIRGGEVRDPERLSGFICGLARNLAIDYFRRRNSQAESLVASEHDIAVPDQSPSPLEQALQIEDARRIRQVLGELSSERDRQVLHRFYIDEEDKDRICMDLKLTSLQFNRVLHRARERFRELYESRTHYSSKLK
jgi:RNA polymerase sigma-70 factor (ECF subfamily)